MKKIAIVAALVIAPVLLVAQSTNISTAFYSRVKKADIYFNHLAYRNALNLYLHAYDYDSGNLYVKDQIAECYFKLHNPVEAEKWYSTIINEPSIHNGAKFEYAEVLSQNGKYEEARYWFEEYLNGHPESKSAKEKIEFINNYRKYLDDTLRFVVTGVDFNSEHSDYGAHYFHEGVVFASSRDMDAFIEHKAFDAVEQDESLLNMYYVKGLKHGEHEEVQELHKEHIKSYLHEGPMAFYNNDKKCAFTRTTMKNGKPVYDKNHRSHLQIVFADVDALGSMTNLVPFEFNNTEYSIAHPTLSPDGSTMYYTSTQPGGYGGSDIYYSTFNNGKWAPPLNAGPEVNSSGDESFPFLANDSTLYFSSDGHGSLGGLDILVSYKKKDGQFGKPLNFGGPLNTRFDDFSFVADSTGRVGYIASNRPGGMGVDDIYYWIATYYFLTGKVIAYDKTGDPIEGATVYAIDDKTGIVIDSAITDQNGIYGLNLPFDNDYKIIVKKQGYDLLNDVPLTTHGRPMGVDSLDVPLWKQELFAKGKIYSNETQEPLSGVTIKVTNEKDSTTEIIDLKDKTDYSFLVRPDGRYKMEFSKPGYTTEELMLDTEKQIRGEVFNDIVLSEESISMAVIHFEYDKSDIVEASIDEMKPLVKVLKKNPKATLNIGAHADSRGSIEYNQRLSDDRAKNTAQYFISQGISKKRITWKGFSENLLLNRCKDGVTCEEIEHSENRRAEIKVQLK